MKTEYEEAQRQLERPLVFGDVLQIKALEILRTKDRIQQALDEFDPHDILSHIGEDIVREWLDDKQPSDAN